jgi:hypothetical protein
MVTGNLTPWSFHIDVIPRFIAMRPVLLELGVHFFGADSVSDASLVEAFSAAALVAGEL